MTKNKEEIIFNCQGLIGTWLFENLERNKKQITDLRLVCEGDCISKIVPCDITNAGKVMGEILYEGNETYKTCKLLGTVDKNNKEFGKIDIK